MKLSTAFALVLFFSGIGTMLGCVWGITGLAPVDTRLPGATEAAWVFFLGGISGMLAMFGGLALTFESLRDDTKRERIIRRLG